MQLLERERFIQDLERLLIQAATGRGSLVFVAGEAGIGRSSLVDGLDHCFDNPGVGGMGFHQINVDMLDLELDPLLSEAMVYYLNAEGELTLGAVEWIVPAEPWDAENDELPQVMGRHLHLNEALGVYVLHGWAFLDNPAGAF